MSEDRLWRPLEVAVGVHESDCPVPLVEGTTPEPGNELSVHLPRSYSSRDCPAKVAIQILNLSGKLGQEHRRRDVVVAEELVALALNGGVGIQHSDDDPGNFALDQ